MNNYRVKKMSAAGKAGLRHYLANRQSANFERFLQEKADVFQVTELKDQAMFWAFQ